MDDLIEFIHIAISTVASPFFEERRRIIMDDKLIMRVLFIGQQIVGLLQTVLVITRHCMVASVNLQMSLSSVEHAVVCAPTPLSPVHLSGSIVQVSFQSNGQNIQLTDVVGGRPCRLRPACIRLLSVNRTARPGPGSVVVLCVNRTRTERL